MPSVWMRSPSGELVELGPGSYRDEDDLQRFIADHPELLASTLADPEESAPWLLVQRELNIVMEEGDDRTRWSLDHLFIDADGEPTLVEVKRSSDPRARREVVAQMLDYAASFRHVWTADSLRGQWASQSDGTGVDSSDDAMDDFLSGTRFEDADAFWSQVQTNIEGNRLRLLFVADGFGPHLVRIIEYLNEQMRTTEVVGIEVVPHSAGERVVAYVPTVRGRTSRSTPPPSERLTMADWNEILWTNHGEAAVESVGRLVNAAKRLDSYTSIGTSPVNPRLFLKFRTGTTRRVYWPITIRPMSGEVTITLRRLMKRHPVFVADARRRAEVIERFATAIGRPIDARHIDGDPTFPVEALTTPDAVDRVADVLRWLAEEADTSVSSS